MLNNINNNYFSETYIYLEIIIIYNILLFFMIYTLKENNPSYVSFFINLFKCRYPRFNSNKNPNNKPVMFTVTINGWIYGKKKRFFELKYRCIYKNFPFDVNEIRYLPEIYQNLHRNALGYAFSFDRTSNPEIFYNKFFGIKVLLKGDGSGKFPTIRNDFVIYPTSDQQILLDSPFLLIYKLSFKYLD